MDTANVDTSLKTTLAGGLGARLLTSILSMAILPLLIISVLTYLVVSAQLEETAHRSLKNLSSVQSSIISQYFDRIILDLTLESERVANITLLEQLSDAFQNSGKPLKAFVKGFRWTYLVEEQGTDLEAFWKTYNYKDVLIIDTQGNILFSLIKGDNLGINLFEGELGQSKFSKAVEKSLNTGKTTFSDLEFYPPSNEIAGFFASALLNDEGDKIGILAFQINDLTLKNIISKNANKIGTEEIYLIGEDRLVRSQSSEEGMNEGFHKKIENNSIKDWFHNNLYSNDLHSNNKNRSIDVISYQHLDQNEFIAVLHPFSISDVVWVILAEIESDYVYAPIHFLAKINITLVAVSLIIVSVLVILLTRRIVHPVLQLSQGVDEASQGNLEVSVNTEDSTELGALAAGYNRMIASLKHNENETDRREWLNKRMAELNDLMRTQTNIKTLSENVISYVCEHINAQSGAFYIVEDESITPTGSYSLKGISNLPKPFCVGEGIVGQSVYEKKTLSISNLNEPIIIRSGSGYIELNVLTVVPLFWNDKPIAVLEFGALSEMDEFRQKFLTRCSLPIAISVVTCLSKNKTQMLLERTQEQAEELRSQQKELCIANKDLTDKSDELKRQKVVLECAQKETEEKAEALAEASKYKSQFLANMSHELRTPLNSLLILARSLTENEDGNLTEDDIESAEYILESGRCLLELINEILDLSKVEAGQIDVYEDQVEISAVIDSMNSRFMHMAEEKSIRFMTTVTDDVPDTFITDNGKMGQILTNLISNAIKFTSQGYVELAVSIEDNYRFSSGEMKAIVFAVKDSGMGIPKNKQSAIFEAFQQADGSTNRTHGGTGLGLSIALSFAKLLGGNIELESIPNQGSTFSIFLPVQHGSAAPASINYSKSSMENKPSSDLDSAYCDQRITASVHSTFVDDRDRLDRSKSLILIIEDDHNFSKIVYNTCHTLQCQAIVAANGEAGIELAKKYPVDGIILDYMLPGADGSEILATLASSAGLQHIPVHIVSALDHISNIEALNIQGFATKPVTKEQLVSIINVLSSANDKTKEISGSVMHNTKKIENDCEAEKCNTPSIDQPIAAGTATVTPINSDLNGTSILLVDDDMRNSFALAKVLRKKNIQVRLASSGQQSLDMLDEHEDIQLVLMDIMMPEMDGYEAMGHIRNQDRFKNLPVIAVTANAMQGDQEKCLSSGANDYLSKPVDIGKLLFKMNKCL
jgi:signal transduction histidine kinase/CheY-like chemotaxis protein/HAMP domain-containing protein